MTAALAKIHIAKKELNLHDDDYRAILERETGQRSAKGLSDAQAGRVLEAFKRLGWKPNLVQGGKAGTAPVSRRPADHETARKARALWISLWQLGVIHDRTEKALEAFARRQLGVAKMQWADQQKMFRLIEALKAMGRRHGWVQDEKGHTGVAALKLLKVQLILAQCEILECETPALIASMTLEQLTDKAAALGVKIRQINMKRLAAKHEAGS